MLQPIIDNKQVVGYLVSHETPDGRPHAVRAYECDAHGEAVTHPAGVAGSTVTCPCGTTIEVAK